MDLLILLQGHIQVEVDLPLVLFYHRPSVRSCFYMLSNK
jgi:hypothetical protein